MNEETYKYVAAADAVVKNNIGYFVVNCIYRIAIMVVAAGLSIIFADPRFLILIALAVLPIGHQYELRERKKEDVKG